MSADMADRLSARRDRHVNATTAAVVIPAQPFDDTLEFFTDTLGFTLDMITPADEPSCAELSGFGTRIRLDATLQADPPPIVLTSETARESLHAPNGSAVSFTQRHALNDAPLVEQLEISRAVSDDNWIIGRAGMRYRDLIPSRLGGRFIASNIEVCDGGPVPDMVHHHAIRFQMIFVSTGWVEVVYEDQGPPFRMVAGDAVLQPPHIRHRVLASSAGAQVVEIGCPASHETLFDHQLELPTASISPTREWGGQTFVRHRAAETPPTGWRHDGWVARDTGIGVATKGLAGARVVTTESASSWAPSALGGEFHFVYVLDGSARFSIDQSMLEPGDSIAIPGNTPWAVSHATSDFSFLEVTLPA